MAASDPSLPHNDSEMETVPAEDPLGLKQPLLSAQSVGVNQQFLVPLGARSLSVLDPYLISSNPIQADFLDNPFLDSPFFPTSQPAVDTSPASPTTPDITTLNQAPASPASITTHPNKATVLPIARTLDPSPDEIEKSEPDSLQLPFTDTELAAPPENHFSDQTSQSAELIQPQRSSTSVPDPEREIDQTIQFQQPSLASEVQQIREPTLQPQKLPSEVSNSQPDSIDRSEPPEPLGHAETSLSSSGPEVQLSPAPATIEAPVDNLAWTTQRQQLQSPSENVATNPQIITPADRDTEPFTEIQAENPQQKIQAQQTDQLEVGRSTDTIDSTILTESTAQLQNAPLTSGTSSVEEVTQINKLVEARSSFIPPSAVQRSLIPTQTLSPTSEQAVQTNEISETQSTSIQPTVIEQPLIQADVADVVVPDVKNSKKSFTSEATEVSAEQSGSSGIEQFDKTADEFISQDTEKTVIQASEVSTSKDSNTGKLIKLDNTVDVPVFQDIENIEIQASLELPVSETSHTNKPTEDSSPTSSELLKSSQMERSDSTSSVISSKKPEIPDAAQVSLSNEINLQTQPDKQAQVSSSLPPAELSATSSFTSDSTDAGNLSRSGFLISQPSSAVGSPEHTVEASILQAKQEAPPSVAFEQPVNELSVAAQDPIPTPDRAQPLTEPTSEQILQRSPLDQTSSANISAQAPLVEGVVNNPQSASTSDLVQANPAPNTTNDSQIGSETQSFQSQPDIRSTSTPSSRNLTELNSDLTITEPTAESLLVQKQAESTDSRNNHPVQQFVTPHQPSKQTQPSTRFKAEQAQPSNLVTGSASASQGVVRQFLAKANQFISRAVDFLSEKDGANEFNTLPKAKTSGSEPSSQRQEDFPQEEVPTPEPNISLSPLNPSTTDSTENRSIAQTSNQLNFATPLTTSSISGSQSNDLLAQVADQLSGGETPAIQAQVESANSILVKQPQAEHSVTIQKTSITPSLENQVVSTSNFENNPIPSENRDTQVSSENTEAVHAGSFENEQTSDQRVSLHLSEAIEQGPQSHIVSPPENENVLVAKTVNQEIVQPSLDESEVDGIQTLGAIAPEVQFNHSEASSALLEASQKPSSNHTGILQSTQLEDGDEGQQSSIERVEAVSITANVMDNGDSITSATKTSNTIQAASESPLSLTTDHPAEAIAESAAVIQTNAEPLLPLDTNSVEETNTTPNSTATSQAVANPELARAEAVASSSAKLSVETSSSMVSESLEAIAPPEQVTQAAIQAQQETVGDQLSRPENSILHSQALPSVVEKTQQVESKESAELADSSGKKNIQTLTEVLPEKLEFRNQASIQAQFIESAEAQSVSEILSGGVLEPQSLDEVQLAIKSTESQPDAEPLFVEEPEHRALTQAQPKIEAIELEPEAKAVLNTSESQSLIQTELATDFIVAQSKLEASSSQASEDQSLIQAELAVESVDETQTNLSKTEVVSQESVLQEESSAVQVETDAAIEPFNATSHETELGIQRTVQQSITETTTNHPEVGSTSNEMSIPMEDVKTPSESFLQRQMEPDSEIALQSDITSSHTESNNQPVAQPLGAEAVETPTIAQASTDRESFTEETKLISQEHVSSQLDKREADITIASPKDILPVQPASNHTSPIGSGVEFTATESSVQRSVEQLETEPIEIQAEREGQTNARFTGNQVAEIQRSIPESGIKSEIQAETEIGTKLTPTENQAAKIQRSIQESGAEPIEIQTEDRLNSAAIDNQAVEIQRSIQESAVKPKIQTGEDFGINLKPAENQAAEIQQLTQQRAAKPVEIRTAIDPIISQATDSLETTIAPFETPAVENFLNPPVGKTTGKDETNVIAPIQPDLITSEENLKTEINQQVQRQPDSNAVESLKNSVLQNVQFNQINHLQTDAIGSSADNHQLSEVSSPTKISSPLANSSLSTSDSEPIIQRSIEEEIGRESEKTPQLPQVLQDLRVLQPLSGKQISGQASPTLVQTKGYINEPAASAFSPASMSSPASATPDQNRLQSSASAFNSSLSNEMTQPLPSQWSSLAELVEGQTAPIQRSVVRKSPPPAKSVQSNSVIQAQFTEQPTPIRVTRNQPPTPVMTKQEATVVSDDDGEETDYLEVVAQAIYDRLRQRLRVEQERHGRGSSGRLPW